MKNMFEILKDTLQNGMEIKNERELSSKWKFVIAYDGMQAATELPKTTVPGHEVEVCKTSINNAMSTMYINAGNLVEAKAWLDGERWKTEDEEIEYKRVNNDAWICNQLEELILKYEQAIKDMGEESNSVSGDEFVEGHIEGLKSVVDDLKKLLYEK